MNIREALGFGHKDPDPNAEDGASIPNSVDVSTSHEVIHNSSGDLYWDQFEAALKIMTPRELNALNYRLGCSVPDNSDWREYIEVVRYYQWFRFCDAYHYATGQTFSTN